MSDDRAAISALVLTAMGDSWSDSEEYSALPGVVADLLLTSDWLAAEKAKWQAEALREAVVDMRRAWEGSWNLRDPRDPEVFYSVDVWLDRRADRIEKGSDDGR